MSLDIPTRWPLVTNPQQRRMTVFQDGRLINCYAELNQQTQEYDVIKRPGLRAYLTDALGPDFSSNGLFIVPGPSAGVQMLLQAVNGILYENGTAQGAISASGRYSWTALNVIPQYAFFGNSFAYYTYTTGVITPITDSFFITIQTTLVPGIAYLNGRVYVCTSTNKVYSATNLEDPTVWSSVNFINANDTIGWARRLVRHLQYIVVMKQYSSEVFYDAGNPTGSPLSRVDGVRIPFGCAFAYSVVTINDNLFWISVETPGNFGEGALKVIRMAGLQPEIISTPAVSRFLIAHNGQLYGSFVQLGGHRFYMLCPDSKIYGETSYVHMLYDLDSGVWSEYTFNPNYANFTAFESVQGSQSTILEDNRGLLYTLIEDPLSNTDVGNIIPIDIYTPNMDFGIDRIKQLSILYINADQQSSAVLQIRRSDDDYQSWSNYRNIDLSKNKPILIDEGSFYRRAYNLHYEADTPFRIRSMGMQMDLGVS